MASMSSASSTTSSTSSGCESPIAAPRRNYSADYEVTISDESRIELSSTASSETSDEVITSFGAECYSVEADVKNEVIYDVSAISNDTVVSVVTDRKHFFRVLEVPWRNGFNAS